MTIRYLFRGIGLDPPLAQCTNHGRCPITSLRFLQNGGDVVFDRLITDFEALHNVFIALALLLML